MKTFELICIVAGDLGASPLPKTRYLAAGALTAVLSAAPRKAISLPLSRADAMKDAAFRQKVFEALMPKGTVLVAKPRQWLTLAQTACCLRSNSGVLADLCRQYRDQVQFQISVSWDAPLVLDHFRGAPELSELFRTGRASAEVFEASLARLRSRFGNDVRDLIEPVATDVIALPTNAEMVCNLAVLIPGKDEIKLDRAVESVDALWSEGLTIRQIGPSAVGSFALVDLEWVSATDVKAARSLLDLDHISRAEHIREVRRRALMHPGSDREAIKRAARIAQAAATADGAADDGIHLIKVLSEDRGHSVTPLNAVA